MIEMRCASVDESEILNGIAARSEEYWGYDYEYKRRSAGDRKKRRLLCTLDAYFPPDGNGLRPGGDGLWVWCCLFPAVFP